MALNEREVLFKILDQIKQLSQPPPTTYAPTTGTPPVPPPPQPVGTTVPPSLRQETERFGTTVR